MKRVIRAAEDSEHKENQSSEEFGDLLSKLQGIGDYSTFIKTLKGLDDNQKELFMTYFGKIDTIKPSVSEKSIPVSDLLPTQSEIDWKKSLSYGLGVDCSYFFKDNIVLGMPVLTYKSKYIIDGHHRWSQVCMFNPEGTIGCINFDFDEDSPLDVLKDFQAAVLAEVGQIRVGKAGTNIWSVDRGTLTKHIDENMSEACSESLINQGVAEDKESAVTYLVDNAIDFQKSIKPIPGAPDRVDMPQTDENVIKRASQSLTDMSAATSVRHRRLR